MNISELTAALKQQRPRRDIHTLPVVESNPSLHGSEAASSIAGASSSPSIISPFAALSHSPHEDSHGNLVSSLESQQAPDANATAAGSEGHAMQQPASGQDLMATAVAGSPPGQSELSFSHQVVGSGPAAQSVVADGEAGYESASSDASQQQRHNPGRGKCVLM